MKFIKIIIIFCIVSACSTQVKKTEPAPAPEDDRLTTFFKNIETDLKSASSIIGQKDLVKYLTHLQTMDLGGKHYYPLERKNITTMIKSLVSYNYAECILFNDRGKIVYTMYNNDLFSKHVKSFNGTPLASIFNKTINNEFHIEDITSYYPYYGKLLFFSKAIKMKNKKMGVLTVAINTDLIKKNLPDNAILIDKSGKFRLHFDSKKFLSQDESYTGSEFYPGKKPEFKLKTPQGEKTYKSFNFKDLSWYIIH